MEIVDAFNTTTEADFGGGEASRKTGKIYCSCCNTSSVKGFSPFDKAAIQY